MFLIVQKLLGTFLSKPSPCLMSNPSIHNWAKLIVCENREEGQEMQRKSSSNYTRCTIDRKLRIFAIIVWGDKRMI